MIKMDEYVTPDKNHICLLTIDVQNDFTLPGAPAEIPGTFQVIPCMQRLVQAFRKRNYPVVHVVRLYLPDGSNVDLCRRMAIEQGKQIVLPGSDGAELVNELKPSPQVRLEAEKLLSGAITPIGNHEWVIYKPRWGAFYRTRLEEHLRSLKVNTLAVCGCNFPNCPRTTIYEASERDFRVVLVTDATSGVYDRGIQELQNIGVNLMNTDEFLAWF